MILQACGFAFTVLSVIVGALLTWAYLSGSTQRALEDHERRIVAIERRGDERSGERDR